MVTQRNKHPGIQQLEPSRRFPNGGWLVRYRDPDNRTLRKTFGTQKAARDFQASVRTDTGRGDFISPQKAAKPFRDVAEAWFEGIESRRRPKTVASYRFILDAHLIDAFGNRPIGRITAAEIERFFDRLGRASGTKRNVINVLNGVFKHAIKSGMVKSNPCAQVELEKVSRREMLFLTAEQVGELADAITPLYRTLVLMAAETGMRAGELAALRVGNVDLMHGRVRVKESVAEVSGKLHYGEPKTNKGIRTIAISSSLVKLLEVQIDGKGRDDLVFTGPNGAPLRHSNYYQRHFKDAVKRLTNERTNEDGSAEPPRWPTELARLRFHDLRHTAASILIDKGVHPKLISDRLGHKSIRVTMDIYGHRFPDQEDAIAASLDGIFKSPASGKRAAVASIRRTRPGA